MYISSWARLVGMLVLQVQRSFPFHVFWGCWLRCHRFPCGLFGSTEFYKAQPTNQGKMSTGTSKKVYISLYIYPICHQKPPINQGETTMVSTTTFDLDHHVKFPQKKWGTATSHLALAGGWSSLKTMSSNSKFPSIFFFSPWYCYKFSRKPSCMVHGPPWCLGYLGPYIPESDQ